MLTIALILIVPPAIVIAAWVSDEMHEAKFR